MDIKDFKEGVQFGNSDGLPVPGDNDGDGKTDIAVFDKVTGVWWVAGPYPNITITTPAAGDIPVPGDYFGDGKTNQAIYRPSNGKLYVMMEFQLSPYPLLLQEQQILNLSIFLTIFENFMTVYTNFL